MRLAQRHLLQGAPSSPTLANLALARLDRRLKGLAMSLGLEYSRYADDLAFSGNTSRDWGFFEPLVGSICLKERFVLNYKKLHLRRPHQKQQLVGIVVNEKPNIDRRYYEQLKATLNNCARHGLESQNRDAHDDFSAHLRGRIQYVKSLNRRKGARLERLYAQALR